MFDDVVPPKSGSTPPNLPLGEPEDMFEKTDSVPSPEPAFDTDTAEPVLPANTALDAGVLKPKSLAGSEGRIVITPPPSSPLPASKMQESSTPSYTIQTPPTALMNEREDMNQISSTAPQEAPFSGRKILVFISIVLILIILGLGSFWIYTSFIKKDVTDQNFIAPDTTDSVPDTTPTTPSSDTTPTPVDSNEDSILFGEPVDTDSDGIVDIDEVTYGTDTLNWDTDADELSDGDEVMIWKTDPRIFDSDNDGYGDGVEIKNGYNPVGTGKLFEPPTSTSVTATGTL